MTEIKNDGRLQGIQIRFTAMRDLVSQLDKAIVDKEAKEFLLGTATNWLGDVESFLIPQGQVASAELTLTLVERHLVHAKKMLSKYGPNLRVIGEPKSGV